MELKTKSLLKGGEFIIKDSQPGRHFYSRRFFGGTNHDERKRSRIY